MKYSCTAAKALWAIQYTPRAAGMVKAIYTENRGMNIIMRLALAAEGSVWGWCFMVILVMSHWLPPARTGMRIRPMAAQVKVKPVTMLQGLAAMSSPKEV